jgi:hypothetical protein
MYLNTLCPYCGKKFKKLSISVIKPGFVTCPHCNNLTQVTGGWIGLAVYCGVLIGFAVIISPYKNRLNDTWVLILFGMTFIVAIYAMSLFLKVKK